jgi:DNA-binding transcriptional ArsR family regulator
VTTRVAADVTADQRAAVFKALGEPTRLRIVDFLRRRGKEATGSEIAEHVGISLALLCHHTDALVEAGLVTKRKEGQTSIWRVNATALSAAVKSLGA